MNTKKLLVASLLLAPLCLQTPALAGGPEMITDELDKIHDTLADNSKDRDYVLALVCNMRNIYASMELEKVTNENLKAAIKAARAIAGKSYKTLTADEQNDIFKLYEAIEKANPDDLADDDKTLFANAFSNLDVKVKTSLGDPKIAGNNDDKLDVIKQSVITPIVTAAKVYALKDLDINDFKVKIGSSSLEEEIQKYQGIIKSSDLQKAWATPTGHIPATEQEVWKEACLKQIPDMKKAPDDIRKINDAATIKIGSTEVKYNPNIPTDKDLKISAIETALKTAQEQERNKIAAEKMSDLKTNYSLEDEDILDILAEQSNVERTVLERNKEKIQNIQLGNWIESTNKATLTDNLTKAIPELRWKASDHAFTILLGTVFDSATYSGITTDIERRNKIYDNIDAQKLDASIGNNLIRIGVRIKANMTNDPSKTQIRDAMTKELLAAASLPEQTFAQMTQMLKEYNALNAKKTQLEQDLQQANQQIQEKEETIKQLNDQIASGSGASSIPTTSKKPGGSTGSITLTSKTTKTSTPSNTLTKPAIKIGSDIANAMKEEIAGYTGETVKIGYLQNKIQTKKSLTLTTEQAEAIATRLGGNTGNRYRKTDLLSAIDALTETTH